MKSTHGIVQDARAALAGVWKMRSPCRGCGGGKGQGEEEGKEHGALHRARGCEEENAEVCSRCAHKSGGETTRDGPGGQSPRPRHFPLFSELFRCWVVARWAHPQRVGKHLLQTDYCSGVYM
jgi:hypothetical protein